MSVEKGYLVNLQGSLSVGNVLELETSQLLKYIFNAHQWLDLGSGWATINILQLLEIMWESS